MHLYKSKVKVNCLAPEHCTLTRTALERATTTKSGAQRTNPFGNHASHSIQDTDFILIDLAFEFFFSFFFSFLSLQQI